MECKGTFSIFNNLIVNILNRFRWVVCQLDVLRKCLKVETLRTTLRSLPESLDETYDRILLSIDKPHRGDAYRVLQWLAFSARPVTLAEVAKALSVDLHHGLILGPDQQLGDPLDILTICSTLVTTSNSSVQLDGNMIEGTGMFNCQKL
jgi:hypothetical protein